MPHRHKTKTETLFNYLISEIYGWESTLWSSLPFVFVRFRQE